MLRWESNLVFLFFKFCELMYLMFMVKWFFRFVCFNVLFIDLYVFGSLMYLLIILIVILFVGLDFWYNICFYLDKFVFGYLR